MIILTIKALWCVSASTVHILAMFEWHCVIKGANLNIELLIDNVVYLLIDLFQYRESHHLLILHIVC